MQRTQAYLLLLYGLLALCSCQLPSEEAKSASPGTTAIDASPWVFWYWNDAAVSKAGITLDLEAMKQQGIAGAYLFFIRGASDPPKFTPTAVQFTDHWWELVRFAFAEAKRLGLQLGLHACDGFSTAGGPWIQPAQSMKKLVWADTLVQGGAAWSGRLPQPETQEDFYEDIKTYAYPIDPVASQSSYDLPVRITTSWPEVDASWLKDPEVTDQRLRSETPGWIQYAFEQPFICRSITIKAAGNIFQANRLIIETSDDGAQFTFHTRLQPHRQGWADGETDITHAIPPVRARYFRLRYDPTGTEPGAEDLDQAKWRQTLKIPGIKLSSEAKIHQYEGKNGSVWRIAAHSDSALIEREQCIQLDELIDLTDRVDDNGQLQWNVPPGNWRIRRIGYTSTGKTNYIGGGAKGLECDKFDPEAVAFQFEQWMGAFYEKVPDADIGEALKIFHVDSWECGSQNWSRVFAEEFKQRRGYDLLPHLLVMTGLPLKSAAFSEKVLLDVRETIAELIRDSFFKTMKELATVKGLQFSAESTAPVMVGDGMLHHGIVDFPMGEFWYNSPTHDKPNDMLDAISGGHIYGKKIIQSESFTEIRLDWDEHPGKLKQDLDRNFALGINRIVFHVFNHNPWVDRKPGMTLGVVGFFFQPSQTWFDTGAKAWMDYIRNCQKWLQLGDPVVDIAVFTGEEVPRRAVLPERLVPILPGLFGEAVVHREATRLQNEGLPLRERPAGVKASAHIADPADWIDPLRGYAYDSFNKDALLRLSHVENGKMVLPGGAAYSILVIPPSRPMMPEGTQMSLPVAQKILDLVQAGATVYMPERPVRLPGTSTETESRAFQQIISTLFAKADGDRLVSNPLGKGQLITGKYTEPTFSSFGLDRDLAIRQENGELVQDVAWEHRRHGKQEIYFLANQFAESKTLQLSFRITDKIPLIYYPEKDKIWTAAKWEQAGNRIELPMQLQAYESCFIIFDQQTGETETLQNNWPQYVQTQAVKGPWQVQFDTTHGGPAAPLTFRQLKDWSKEQQTEIRHYSGTAVYHTSFHWEQPVEKGQRFILSLGEVHDLAQVKVNGRICGVAWTAPYTVDITEQLQPGENHLEIEVSNTWANRLIGDQALEEEERVSWTTAPYRLEGRDLLPAGLLGPVSIMKVR